MGNGLWRIVSAALLVGTLVVARPASAQYRGPDWRMGGQQAAFDNGYREGVKDGDEDARGGREFGYQRHDDYRDADKGYRRAYGNRETYRSAFRQAYARGYEEAYYRWRGNSGRNPGWTAPRGYPDDRGYGYPNRQTYPGYPGPYRPDSVAYTNGFSDGYKEGFNDGEDRDRYNPIGERRYRSADHGYNDRYGPRELYKTMYRDGFRAGYDEGYRDARNNRGRRARNWGF